MHHLTHMPSQPVSRLAPTPSGFLHLGNAMNFLVTWALTRHLGGTLHLRIDDMDKARFRKEVLEDIFFSLDWLGIDWDLGPAGPDDFLEHFSLQKRIDVYRDALKQLLDRSQAFACPCSRSQIAQVSSTGLYPGTCRNMDMGFVPNQTAVRLKVPNPAMISVEGKPMNMADIFGDFVIWRKDDQPSYHLASLVEDEAMGTSLVVRGADLFDSTAAQLFLAQCLGYTIFPKAFFFHHELILGKDGQKLSKSRGAYALKDIRESGRNPAQAVRMAAQVLNLPHQEVSTARDLVLALAE